MAKTQTEYIMRRRKLRRLYLLVTVMSMVWFASGLILGVALGVSL